MPQLRALKAKADGVSAIRTETFRGRTYTVVPVVALVEGVLQGLNAEEPEYAPAAEFGKFPLTWDGRPITMGHPRRNGQLTSANAPDMREEYEFGFLANTVLDNSKLKTEAWIDDDLVAEKGGDFETTRQRLLDGELVEVSTGLFCDVFAQKGTYNGEKYGRAWANVVPDHLAFLEEGTLGACSGKDGCGAPRLNENLRIHETATNKGGEILTSSPMKLGNHAAACCDACAKGESCMDLEPEEVHANTGGGDEAPNSEGQEGSTSEGESANQPTDQLTGQSEDGAESGSEVGTSEPGDEAPGEVAANSDSVPEEIAQHIEANEQAASAFDRFVNNAVASSVTLENARSIVQQALREYTGGYAYVIAMTTEQVAFEVYDCHGYEGTWGNVAMNYSIGEDGGVTLTGEPVPVNLMISIVPRATVTVNEGASGANQQEEGHMDEENAQTGESNAGELNANGAGNAPAAPTFDEFLASAPPEYRAVLNEGVALREQRKTKLVQSILANSKVFTNEELTAKDIPELEKLAAMSRPAQDFSGRAMPRFVDPTGGDLSANERQDSVPEPLRAFEAKPRRRADYSDTEAGASVN